MAAPSGMLRPPVTIVSGQIASLITDYLGPSVHRAGAVEATLNSLRVRLENGLVHDETREELCKQTREAIRTEFFKKRFPHPPSPRLLALVRNVEVLLTEYKAETFPYFFPGARVSVPSDANVRRPGTTLQLRLRPSEAGHLTEALIHIDGVDGGSFSWAQTGVLLLLPMPAIPAHVEPVVEQGSAISAPPKASGPPKPSKRPPVRKVPVLPSRPAVASRGTAKAPNPGSKTGTGGGLAPSPRSTSVSGAAATARTPDVAPPTALFPHVAHLAPTFIPDALRETIPPPRKRLRHECRQTPVTLASGLLKDAAEARGPDGDLCDSTQVRSLAKHLQVIERLVARRRNTSNGGVVEYYVKWLGAAWEESSWESREALMEDVPGLVIAFDSRHPWAPSPAAGQGRDVPAGEQKTHEARMAAMQAAEQRAKEREEDVNKPILIPDWADVPILELTFAGMSLVIRRNEGHLFPDTLAPARDLKRRRAKFKQEYPEKARFVLGPGSRTELAARDKATARSVLDTTSKLYKARGSRLINFPRGLGRVIRTDIASPIPHREIYAAPYSWERYFLDLGLDCKNWDRRLLPHMPYAPAGVKAAMRDAVAAQVQERRELGRERVHRMAQEALDKSTTGVGLPDLKGRRELAKIRRVTTQPVRSAVHPSPDVEQTPDSEATSLPAHSAVSGNREATQAPSSAPSPVNVSSGGQKPGAASPAAGQNELLRERVPGFAQALDQAMSQSVGKAQYYDPYWCCWRPGQGATRS